MAFATSTIAAISAVTAVAGVAMQIKGQQDAKKASNQAAEARERQAAAEQRKAEVQNIRAMREQIREQRMAAARITARGATAGTSGSSGVAGGVASTGSQLATNLDYMRNVATQDTAIRGAALDYGIAQGNIAQAQAFGNLGGTIFGAAGGFDTIFGGMKQPDIKGP